MKAFFKTAMAQNNKYIESLQFNNLSVYTHFALTLFILQESGINVIFFIRPSFFQLIIRFGFKKTLHKAGTGKH